MFTALSSTSVTLSKFLQASLEEAIPELFDDSSGGSHKVTTNNPEEMTGIDGEEGISLWLYRVVRDGYRYNDPPERESENSIKRQPLPVRLHYLATPIISKTSQNHEMEQVILGRVLQTFHDTPKLRGAHLRGDFEDSAVELTIRLESMSLEEITRVWDALESSYQLSVSYEVSVIYVESALGPESVVPVEIVIPKHSIIVDRGES